MKRSPKEHYQQLRHLSCAQLWEEEVPAFDRASERERMENVGIIRAVGVVFSESGTAAQKALARDWLGKLLHDPAEKVRRYAMAALPKIGADGREEGALLELLQSGASEREQKFLGRALEKIGGEATLGALGQSGGRTAQKARANVVRREQPSTLQLDRVLTDFAGIKIQLHGRHGLEELMERELRESGAPFRVMERAPERLTLAPQRGFSLGDLYALRCFSSASLLLGTLPGEELDLEAIVALVAAPTTLRWMETFTAGPLRYRLELVGKGHQRGAVRRLGDRVFALRPELINDSREAPWQINITQSARTTRVELSPRWKPDPRFSYRLGDVPAASHPPLAACMALLAGKMDCEIVWDPFCGSGLELIERARIGGVSKVIGTDLSAAAVEIAEENLRAARLPGVQTAFLCADFRDYRRIPALAPNGVSLIVTNPPLGRRVPIPNLRELMADLFAAAENVLRPGGRLVFVNPLSVQPARGVLKLEYRQRIDLGGFFCHLEKYVKTGVR